jgi:bifunctional oligoribonuclease and PAP phosphatase NrnA
LNILNTSEYRQIKELLSTPKNIAILIHKNPDGDAIGSSLGLYHYLKKLNHHVRVISPNDYPKFLKWLSGSNDILNSYKTPDLAVSTINKADIIFCLDFNSIERVNFIKDIFNASNAVKILIDHHPQPEPFCKYVLSKIETSSAAELVYDFIIAVEGKLLIDKDIAECLYVGIMTDTGSYSYSCNLPQTYLATAELIDKGIDAQRIHNLIYDTYSENRMRLLGYSLNSAMKVFDEYSAAYIALTKEELKKFHHQTGDTEGFVNYPISMHNVCLSALFMEMGDQIKISFRSKGSFNVNEFARKHFEGGGHKNAAGGKSNLPMEEVIRKFEQLLPEYKDSLNCQ